MITTLLGLVMDIFSDSKKKKDEKGQYHFVTG
jgi:hypothetical protein